MQWDLCSLMLGKNSRYYIPPRLEQHCPWRSRDLKRYHETRQGMPFSWQLCSPKQLRQSQSASIALSIGPWCTSETTLLFFPINGQAQGKTPHHVPPIIGTNQQHVYYHKHISLTNMHGKHFGLLHARVMLVHMPLGLSWLVFQKVQKIQVLTYHTYPISTRFILLLI